MNKHNFLLCGARFIGLSFGSLWIFIIVFQAITEGKPQTIESVLLFVLIIANLSAVIISLKSVKVGGLLLSIFALLFCLFSFLAVGHNKLLAVLVSGVPFLISGIMLLYYDYLQEQ
jgi:succinate-acetate transporter protein